MWTVAGGKSVWKDCRELRLERKWGQVPKATVSNSSAVTSEDREPGTKGR